MPGFNDEQHLKLKDQSCNRIGLNIFQDISFLIINLQDKDVIQYSLVLVEYIQGAPGLQRRPSFFESRSGIPKAAVN